MRKVISAKSLFVILFLISFVIIVFRKYFFQGLLPVPFNMLAGWYFPYNLGGWEGYFPGITFKGGLHAADVFRQMIPWKQLSIELIKSGELPLWNPYNFSGEPLLANIQATTFYPLTLLFLALNFNKAWSIYIILSPLLASIFTFLFLRSLKLSRFASLLGSLAFAFSGHMISWLEWGVVTHSALWLPLILFSLTKWLRDSKPWALLVFILAIFATIMGGYPQESVYALLLSTAYFFWLQKSKPSSKTLLIAVTLVLTTLLIISVQLIPTLKLFNQSALKGQASESLYLKTRLSPQHSLTLFSPDYFGNRIKNNYWANSFTAVDYTDANMFVGSTALIFAIYSLFQPHRSRTNNFFLWAFSISWVLSLNSPLTFIIGKLNIPIVSTGVASGILFLTVFSISVLAAFGFDFWRKYHPSTPVPIITAIYIFIALTTLFVPPEFRRVTIRNLAIPFTIAALSLAVSIFYTLVAPNFSRKLNQTNKYLKIGKLLTFSALILIATVEYGIYSNLMLSFSSPVYAYPKHQLIEKTKSLAKFDRVAGFWDSEIFTNLHTQFKLYSTEGYNPLHSLNYQQLIASTKDGNLPKSPPRSDADFDQNNQHARDRFLDMSSVKYIYAKVTDPTVSWEQEPLKYSPDRYSLLWQQERFKIYQNKDALNRVELFNKYQAIPNIEQRLKTVYSTDWSPHESLILNSQLTQEINSTATGSAKITNYHPNRVEIQTNTTNGNMLLLLTDNYYSSWKAYIDEEQTSILIANHTFRAVVVPPGEHQILFQITWP